MVAVYRRLEFEPELIAQITADGKPRRRRRVFPALSIVAVACLAVLLTGAISARSTFFSADRTAIVQMAEAFFDGLRTGSVEHALTVFAENAQSGGLLYQEEERIFLAETRPANLGPADLRVRATQLEQVRSALSDQGVNWTEAVPVAFGGARARVFDPSFMREPASVIIGNLYFLSEGRVYAIELSAWRCGRAFVIVDVWHWGRLDVSPGSIEQHAIAAYDRFRYDAARGDGEAEILHPRKLYIAL